jgi:hypothetical protein
MTGGIVQLVAKGKEDIFLTNDPQITFFKVLYRRHTNFAREEICKYFINEPDFGKRSTCIIDTSGDLIDNMSLRIVLPTINKLSKRGGTDTKFAWVRRIGHSIIKTIEIEINGKVIDRHYGEWLHIWNILTTHNTDSNGFDKLIGNVPELTDFTYTKDEYVLYVPLYFWFCRTSGLALPIMNLHYCDIKINLELFELEKCYIVSPTHYIKCYANIINFEPYEYIEQITPDGIHRYGIFSHFDVIEKRLYYTPLTKDKFIGVPYSGDINNVDSIIEETILNAPKANNYKIKGNTSDFITVPYLLAQTFTSQHKSLRNVSLKECMLMIDYVYLDDDERLKFARTKQDYLIEQLYFTPNISIQGTNQKIKLNIDNTCKMLIWFAQFDYIYNSNDRLNFTDTHIRKIKSDNKFIDNEKIKIYHNIKVGNEIGTSLIEEDIIRLNSQDRLTKRENTYFEKIQTIQHSKNILPKGVSMYSFALFPLDVAPSGTTNMSQIELAELNLRLNYKVGIEQPAKVRAYALCYNIWRVDNGLSAVVFVR